jgi:hypothetical protein
VTLPVKKNDNASEISLIICATVFAQLLLRSTKSAKKKKTHKKFLKHPLSETSKDICGSRRHRIRVTLRVTLRVMAARHLRNAHATKVQKIKKSTKNEKTRFF